jgi:hypothetical protein
MIHGGMQVFNLFFDPFVFYISDFSEKAINSKGAGFRPALVYSQAVQMQTDQL